MYLLDTNILSELIKAHPSEPFIARLSTVSAESLATASICVMELRYGALKTKRHPDLWPTIRDQILSRIRILDFGFHEALTAAEILNRLYSLGNPIGLEDVMIGATGLANGLTVVTGNTKHFLCIEGLTVENWLI